MSGIRVRNRQEVECGHCKKRFYVPWYRRETTKFCSRSCMALASRNKITANCAVCRKEFTHISSRANRAKYCSNTCKGRAYHHKGTRTYQCQHCRNEFQGSPSLNRKYCSRACINKVALTDWHPSFTTVRGTMLRRGMITACARCGYSESRAILGVHHKDRNRNNNSLDNLEVLCPNCHSLEHSKHVGHGFRE